MISERVIVDSATVIALALVASATVLLSGLIALAKAIRGVFPRNISVSHEQIVEVRRPEQTH